MQITNKKFYSILIKFFIIYTSLFFFINKAIFARETINYLPEINEKTSSDKTNFNPNNYLLDSGDYISINLRGLPEYSGVFPIGPDGYLYLPQKIKTKASGYTLAELETNLLVEFKKQIINPNLFLRIVAYRPVRVYIHGEVSRPGFYTIKDTMTIYDDEVKSRGNPIPSAGPTLINPVKGSNILSGIDSFSFPTLYDSLKASQGINAYSDLSKIVITRIINNSTGEKIQTTVNLLSLFKEGDQSQNIRIYDKDIIEVKKTSKLITEQLSLVRKSNLNPDNLFVFLGGMVFKPGETIVPKGSSLNQAIEIGGGKKFFTGKIEFLRFQGDGLTDKRIFKYDSNAKLNSYSNPILMSGDIINVKDSLFRKSSEVLKTVTDPFVGVYSVFKLFGFD
tara:strand:+ start:786 stop:1964 length:1179 start_codon:yes stop_codon:yes gene_type:complete